MCTVTTFDATDDVTQLWVFVLLIGANECPVEAITPGLALLAVGAPLRVNGKGLGGRHEGGPRGCAVGVEKTEAIAE